jgi:uncharacterized protein YuzE
MKKPYLEVTYRQGRAMAAYLYLPRRPGERSFRSRKADPGLVIDFNRSGKPIGIEITAPDKVTAAALNRVLRDLGLDPIRRLDLAPLRAA